MMKPTIHLNGTARAELFEGFMQAMATVDMAIDAVRKTHPHGRDFYPQGPDAIITATTEHSIRVSCLEAIRAELEELATATMG